MRNSTFRFGLGMLLCLAPLSPVSAGEKETPREAVVTLGAIQKSIKIGMSSSEVVEAVGSPNLVTRSRSGRESWVYDRFSTETLDVKGQAGGFIVFPGVGAAAGGGSARKSTTSQRNLILILAFDPDGMVESFSYRSSRF